MFLLYFIYKCIYSFAINIQISSTDATYFDKRVFLLIFISAIELDNVTGEFFSTREHQTPGTVHEDSV